MFTAVPEDYVSISFLVIFVPDSSSSRILCSNISITSDEIVEDTETFLILINTSDSNVQITQPNVSVTILDNSGKFCIYLAF